jgi:hypothetical protein
VGPQTRSQLRSDGSNSKCRGDMTQGFGGKPSSHCARSRD